MGKKEQVPLPSYLVVTRSYRSYPSCDRDAWSFTESTRSLRLSGRAGCTQIRVAGRDDERLRRLVEDAAARGIAVARVSRDALERESRGGIHQGVVADVSSLPEAHARGPGARRARPAADRGSRRRRGPAERGRDPADGGRCGRHGGGPANPPCRLACRRSRQGLGRRHPSRAGRRRRQHRPGGRGTEGTGRLDGRSGRRQRNAILWIGSNSTRLRWS